MSYLQAQYFARRALDQCVRREGIIAGNHHFVDLWARDSLFATFGADVQSAQRTIKTFLRYQRRDGLIPYRIFRRGGMLVPNFRSLQSGGLVPDGGLMTMIATGQLRDKTFLYKHALQIQKSIGWYRRTYGHGLIAEWFQCEWADAVLKVGKTLYTNVLYWTATRDVHIKQKINDTFWNSDYFADWADWKRQDFFASHPNMLAIVFDLATKDQSKKILAYAKKHCWNGWALQENYPAYPWWRIPIQNYLAGMGDYHNRGVIWLQPTILYAVALKKTGKIKEARDVFGKISEKIVEHRGVYEIYEKNGKPVRRLFYQAEHPFAWSSGLYLWAQQQIFGKLRG